MDGNGRWAERRGLPRTAGHRAGGRTLEQVIEAAPRLGIGTLTLYAFSSDNWNRPMPEVTSLMRLLRSYLRKERERAVRNGVAVEGIGRAGGARRGPAGGGAGGNRGARSDDGRRDDAGGSPCHRFPRARIDLARGGPAC